MPKKASDALIINLELSSSGRALKASSRAIPWRREIHPGFVAAVMRRMQAPRVFASFLCGVDLRSLDSPKSLPRMPRLPGP